MNWSLTATIPFVVLLAFSGAALKTPDQPPATCDSYFRKPGLIKFYFGGNYPPYEYLVDKPHPHKHAGFSIEFTQLLCNKFSLNCTFIRVPYEECWLPSDQPGRRIIDTDGACASYTDTYLRRTSGEFSHAYTRGQPAGLLSRLDEKGAPVINPRANDLTGFKIAFIGGWATDAGSFSMVVNGCTKESFSGYEEVVPEAKSLGPDAAMRELVEGRVDGVFAFSGLIDNRKNCETRECDAGLYGHLGVKYAWIHMGMMEYQANGTTLAFTGKGSSLNEFLNPFIDEMLESKEYAELCEKEEYANEDILCFRNSHMNKSEPFPNRYISDLHRTYVCKSRPDPEVCNACSSGYCGCEVPDSDPSPSAEGIENGKNLGDLSPP